MYNEFIYKPKTTIYFGKSYYDNIGKILKKYSDSIAIISSNDSFMINLINEIKESCNVNSVNAHLFNTISANPKLSQINEIIDKCREKKIMFILGVGGGSSMDAAKYISASINYDGNLWDYPMFEKYTHKVLPHGAISTTPATGSEVSNVAMIVNDIDYKTDIKKMFSNDELCFDFVCINPKIGLTIPKSQIVAGSVDIISHCLEIYFTNTENADLMKGYLETNIKLVMKSCNQLINNSDNLNALYNLWLTSIQPMGAQPYIQYVNSDWVVHNIEKPITSYYNQTHGLILGIITIAWMKHQHKSNITSFFRWAIECMGSIPYYEDQELTIIDGISKFELWLKQIGLPIRLSEISIDKSLFEIFASQSVEAFGYCGMISKLTKDEVIEILNIAW